MLHSDPTLPHADPVAATQQLILRQGAPLFLGRLSAVNLSPQTSNKPFFGLPLRLWRRISCCGQLLDQRGAKWDQNGVRIGGNPFPVDSEQL